MNYVTLGFSMLMDGSNESVNVRLFNFQFAMNLFSQSYVIGWGPAKAIHPTVLDSEYSLILSRYGLIGLTVFASFLFLGLRDGMILIAKKHVQYTSIAYCCVMLLLFSIVVMVGNNVFSGYQLMAPVVLMCMAVRSGLIGRDDKSYNQRANIYVKN
jgi:hypothetical protein